MARGGLAGASVVLVCFDGQVRVYRRGEADILMDQPRTRTDRGLDDTYSLRCVPAACVFCFLQHMRDVTWPGMCYAQIARLFARQEGLGPRVVRRQEGLRSFRLGQEFAEQKYAL